METLAPYGWRQDRPVAEALFAEGHRFDFLQAVRLLESLWPGRTPVAEGIDPEREVVRFRSKVRLDFPASGVEEVRPPQDGGPAVATVNLMSLAGLLGPLPPPVTELLLDRSSHRDTALQDFLDLFNHRLVSLLFRARRKYRPALDPRAPEAGRAATVLRALLGLGTPHLQERMELPDRALFSFTGLLTGFPRSMDGLERIASAYFAAEARVVPFQGRWQLLDESDVTRIGGAGQHHALGRGAILGRRIWDQAAGFEVRLGPLALARFRDFLPHGQGFRALAALVRFCTREELVFSFRLVLRAAEVPELRLSRAGGARLGWTSWLKTRPFEYDDSQVRLRGRL